MLICLREVGERSSRYHFSCLKGVGKTSNFCISEILVRSNSCWMVSEGFERVRSGFPHFDPPYLEGCSGAFGKVLERILLSLVNILFVLKF